MISDVVLLLILLIPLFFIECLTKAEAISRRFAGDFGTGGISVTSNNSSKLSNTFESFGSNTTVRRCCCFAIFLLLLLLSLLNCG